jgi:hypothetical protein
METVVFVVLITLILASIILYNHVKTNWLRPMDGWLITCIILKRTKSDRGGMLQLTGKDEKDIQKQLTKYRDLGYIVDESSRVTTQITYE